MLLITDFGIGDKLLLSIFVFGRNKEGDSLVAKAKMLSEGPFYTNLILKYLNLVFDMNYPKYILIFNKLVHN